MAAAVFLFIGIPNIIWYNVYVIGPQQAEYQRRCEAIGGVVLDRTYTNGKSTGHNYTCVDAKIVLNPKER